MRRVTNMPERKTYESLLSLGVISDIQYADVDDAYNYEQCRMRYYRQALDHTKDAIRTWKHSQVNFAVQLGDLIDARTRVTQSSERTLTTVLNEINELGKPVYHVIGNHELYCFQRKYLEDSSLNSRRQFASSAAGDKVYYTFSPFDKFRIIVLDTFDISMLGVEKNSCDYSTAETLIRSKNKNDDLNNYENLPDKYSHYAMFNGGVGDEQLLWLEQTLTDAEQHNENVLIMGTYLVIFLVVIKLALPSLFMK
jgi:manganese-dependent ADP-ribose/CDP-alcohol diphosphatase